MCHTNFDATAESISGQYTCLTDMLMSKTATNEGKALLPGPGYVGYI
jgi:hypothetical protein